MKKVVLIGATTNPSRYAYIASNRLVEKGHNLIPVGIRKGAIAGHAILDLRTHPNISDVDTVTLYVGPKNLQEWEEYVISLQPKRIIFNPGTENHSLYAKAKEANIETLEACTLVMLAADTF